MPGHTDKAASGYSPSAVKIRALKRAIILNPVTIQGDPYLSGSPGAPDPAEGVTTYAVCGVRFVDTRKERYEIQTFRDAGKAARNGYVVTHRGGCGTCSTLRDLAVYLQRRDLTYAVRSCSFRITRSGILSCLEEIGFSRSCALTWYYNIRNTGRRCLGVCLLSWMVREPLNRPDGRLNDCLRCDEEESGPVFKRSAGRTRRNSGIPSEIGRGSDEIYPLAHDYY